MQWGLTGGLEIVFVGGNGDKWDISFGGFCNHLGSPDVKPS